MNAKLFNWLYISSFTCFYSLTSQVHLWSHSRLEERRNSSGWGIHKHGNVLFSRFSTSTTEDLARWAGSSGRAGCVGVGGHSDWPRSMPLSSCSSVISCSSSATLPLRSAWIWPVATSVCICWKGNMMRKSWEDAIMQRWMMSANNAALAAGDLH